jgi:hypothetical protein
MFCTALGYSVFCRHVPFVAMLLTNGCMVDVRKLTSAFRCQRFAQLTSSFLFVLLLAVQCS